MPHQCTDCGRTFDDGSKEMLSGCPDCGGNKFQFQPDRSADGSEKSSEPPEPPEPPEPAANSSVARTVGSAATAVRDLVGGNDTPRPGVDADSTRDSGDRGERRSSPTATPEDAAQASARSETVSPDALPPAPDRSTRSRPAPVMDGTSDRVEDGTGEPMTDGTDRDGTPHQDRPDLDELREQLNEQFESIRVLEPGQYELNLMELYDREEYIIALQEDGKYTIQVPERWNE